MVLTKKEKNDVIHVAGLMADAAAKHTLSHFRSSELISENKIIQGFDPVTQADRAAEKAMRAILAIHRANDSILAEEFDNVVGSSGLTWVLDPIDGTRGFISGTPTWGSLIALSDATGPIFGLIDQPFIGERFLGGLGHCVVKGHRGVRALKTRGARPLDESTIFTTFPEIGSKQEAKAFHAVASQCRLTRYGMDCYAYALLALGQIDLVIEAGLAPYDIQAPIAVVQAAGGIVTNWQGEAAHYGGQVVAAANPEIHDAALKILGDYV